MKRLLADVSRASSAVAGDVSVAGERAQKDDVGGVRREAVRLNRDARTLAASAGSAAYGLRRLEQSERERRARQYFSLLVQTLSWQWAESQTLMQLSAALWADPLAQSSADAHRQLRLITMGRSEARSAEVDSRRAAALRRQYRRVFRYIPVLPSHPNST
jgi:hypothetical protein